MELTNSNVNDFYGLHYAEFTVLLVKAVQELNEKNENLETQVQLLEAKLDALSSDYATEIDKIKSKNAEIVSFYEQRASVKLLLKITICYRETAH